MQSSSELRSEFIKFRLNSIPTDNVKEALINPLDFCLSLCFVTTLS